MRTNLPTETTARHGVPGAVEYKSASALCAKVLNAFRGDYGLTRRKSPKPLEGRAELGISARFREPTNASVNAASPQPVEFAVEFVCSVKPDAGVVHETQKGSVGVTTTTPAGLEALTVQTSGSSGDTLKLSSSNGVAPDVIRIRSRMTV